MTFASLIENLKLTPAAKRELDHVLQLPEVQSILGREEQAELVRRRALIDELSTLPAKHAKNRAAAEKVAIRATENLRLAEENLRLAKDAYAAALSAGSAADGAEHVEIALIIRELEQGADPRLAEYAHHLDRLNGTLSTMYRYQPVVGERDGWTGKRETRIESNLGEINAARNLIEAALRDCQDMRLQAVSRTDTSERLSAWSSKIAELVEVIDQRLQIPMIDERGEVIMRARQPNLLELHGNPVEQKIRAMKAAVVSETNRTARHLAA